MTFHFFVIYESYCAKVMPECQGKNKVLSSETLPILYLIYNIFFNNGQKDELAISEWKSYKPTMRIYEQTKINQKMMLK
jgi:hypothetical protein